ncbi:hypothetical protein [Roseiconus lacunae]|uniref:hypothetical protein n=1 Tax=Roseiconus lacunae TaxID=2605694 RepID=UPI001E3CC671|nr:hypothetical protein [Roseiconus lacunae]MCD0462027.1 hypothetical protein [Roseiconus lacunae]
MTNLKLHVPTDDNLITVYKCGLVAGQSVALRKQLVVHDHRGEPTGRIHPEGEVWGVLPGLESDPVLWLREPDGSRHTWDDDASVHEWFTLVDTPESH